MASEGSRDDARLVATAQLHELRHQPWEELLRRSRAAPEVRQVTGLSGQPLRRRTVVRPAGTGRLLVVITVDDGTRRSRLAPLAEERVLASDDGAFTGEPTPGTVADAAPGHPGVSPRGQLVAALVALVALALIVLVLALA